MRLRMARHLTADYADGRRITRMNNAGHFPESYGFLYTSSTPMKHFAGHLRNQAGRLVFVTSKIVANRTLFGSY